MALYWLAIFMLNGTLCLISAARDSWLSLGVTCAAMLIAFHCLWKAWR